MLRRSQQTVRSARNSSRHGTRRSWRGTASAPLPGESAVAQDFVDKLMQPVVLSLAGFLRLRVGFHPTPPVLEYLIELRLQGQQTGIVFMLSHADFDHIRDGRQDRTTILRRHAVQLPN